MSMYKIAVIGDKDSILGFKALGVTTFPVTSAEAAAQTLRKLARERYGIVSSPSRWPAHRRLIDELALGSAFGGLIPNNAGTLGLGMERIKRNVEKAVGADILFGKEGR